MIYSSYFIYIYLYFVYLYTTCFIKMAHLPTAEITARRQHATQDIMQEWTSNQGAEWYLVKYPCHPDCVISVYVHGRTRLFFCRATVFSKLWFSRAVALRWVWKWVSMWISNELIHTGEINDKCIKDIY